MAEAMKRFCHRVSCRSRWCRKPKTPHAPAKGKRRRLPAPRWSRGLPVDTIKASNSLTSIISLQEWISPATVRTASAPADRFERRELSRGVACQQVGNASQPGRQPVRVILHSGVDAAWSPAQRPRGVALQKRGALIARAAPEIFVALDIGMRPSNCVIAAGRS